MVICVTVDCKSNSRQGKGREFFINFQETTIWNSKWLTKIERRNIKLIQHAIMCHAYCFG